MHLKPLEENEAQKGDVLNDEPKPLVLLCATMWWPLSARLAMAFLRHGWRVSAVCPPGHPLRHVPGVEAFFPYRSLNSASSLRAAIRAARPALIVPCDDGVVWQLHDLHAGEPDLRPLIEYSLGPAEAYSEIEKRGEVLGIAAQMGIRVPSTQTVRSVEDLEGWCLESPAVLKMDGTWGGEGVVFVRSHAEAVEQFRLSSGAMRAGTAWKRFLVNRRPLALWNWRRHKAANITIQEFIPGRPATTMFACWRGEVLASVTVEVLASQGATGSAVVVRLLQDEEIESAARRVARRFMLNGFHGLDFVLEEGSGSPYMIELNPRCTQLGHLRLPGQGDLVEQLIAKIRGESAYSSLGDDCIQSNIIAFFPQAFHWDPRSKYLLQGHHDVPWEEPGLVRELLRAPWPNRQLLSRVYHRLRVSKLPDREQERSLAVEMEWPPSAEACSPAANGAVPAVKSVR